MIPLLQNPGPISPFVLLGEITYILGRLPIEFYLNRGKYTQGVWDVLVLFILYAILCGYLLHRLLIDHLPEGKSWFKPINI